MRSCNVEAFMKRMISVCLTAALLCGLLSGCGDNGNDTINTIGSGSTADPVEMDFAQSEDDMFTNRDLRTEYEGSGSIHISLNGTWAEASSNSVKISGTTVTIIEEATYLISGTLEDGMIIVDAPDTAKLQLVLDNVSIHSEISAPLYILEADKVFVTLADGTENTLSNGGSFTAIDENNIDAVVFSKQDLTFNGSGSLTVTSPAGHGIVSKDDLVIAGGTFLITAASHGLEANDSVRIKDASITIEAGKDGIHAENNDDDSRGFVYLASGEVTIDAQGDGISAGAFFQMEKGTVNIVAGGGSENGTKSSSGSYGGFPGRPGQSSSATADEDSTSMKGIKAAGSLLIADGSITVNSADDSIHANGSVVINGGSLELASGDDGIHADEKLTITAGTIHISESYEGLEALHIDVQGGDIRLTATDDGLNAAGGTDSSGNTGGRDGMFGGPGRPGGMGGGMSSSSNGTIVISGGNLYVKASGDGVDANGTLEISGGYIVVVGPTQGDTATLDYDVSGVITGGTFIGTGASGMAQTFSDSEQGVIAVGVGTQSAGTTITIEDKDGNLILSYEPELSFAVVIYSDPNLVSGETYHMTVGSISGDVTAN